MAVKVFKKINVRTRNLEDMGRDIARVQDNIEQFAQPIVNSEIIDGTLCKNVSLTAGVANDVTHMLGRKPLGWMLVRKRQDSRIWDLQDDNPNPTTTLTMACSHDVTVDIWFF
jgi:hypothetical protein